MSGGRCIWFEFGLPEKIKKIINLWRLTNLKEFCPKDKSWDKDSLHTTYMYCGSSFEYTTGELEKILNTVNYTPIVKISDFKRGDWSPVYFLTLDEVTKNSSGTDHHSAFKEAYKIATSNGRTIDMHGHNEGEQHPGLHITIFWASKDQKVDSKVIEKAKNKLFDELKKEKIETFQFTSIKVMSENPRTKKDYVVFGKKFIK